MRKRKPLPDKTLGNRLDDFVRAHVALATAVDNYLDEYDNPAKDYGLRAIRRDQLRLALDKAKLAK